MKLEPVAEELARREIDYAWLNSGQSKDLVDTHEDDPIDWSELPVGMSHLLVQMTSGFLDSFDLLVVVGDTATAFSGALAAFLDGTPVAHLEAGLRTYAGEPRPEEAFRSAIARFASVHLCPDQRAFENLLNEGCGYTSEGNVFVVGNTSIDALGGPFALRVLGTFHRRENWGERIESVLSVLSRLSRDELVEVRVITHPNWSKAVSEPLEAFDGIEFLEPMPHERFQDELVNTDLVVTDSGGLQEECAAWGIDCVVWRTATERTALEETGAVKVVSPDDPLTLWKTLRKRVEQRICYGRGNAAEAAVDVLVSFLGNDEETVETRPKPAALERLAQTAREAIQAQQQEGTDGG